MSVWDELGLCYRLNFATNESLLGRDNLLTHTQQVGTKVQKKDFGY